MFLPQHKPIKALLGRAFNFFAERNLGVSQDSFSAGANVWTFSKIVSALLEHTNRRLIIDFKEQSKN
jgi:hypothetical protein